MAFASTSFGMSLWNKFECISLSEQACLQNTVQTWTQMYTNLDFHIANLRWNCKLNLIPHSVFLQIYFKTFPSLTSILELNMHSRMLKLNCGRVRKQKLFEGELQFRSPVAGLWCHYMSWCIVSCIVGYQKEPIKTCLDVNISILQENCYIYI